MRREVVDVPGSPTRGNRTRVTLAYHRALDEKFSHLGFSAVSEQFVELFDRRTASVRLGMIWRHAPGDDRVPFYNLAYLGGIENIRGYTRGRFRDRGALSGGITYKYPIWRVVDGTLFYESGRTFHALDEIAFDHWASSVGFGLRVWVPDGLVFEQLVARSDEELRLLVNFKTVF
jgi:outer membrane protein assembly factor BamA